jgi:hypothetical protein
MNWLKSYLIRRRREKLEREIVYLSKAAETIQTELFVQIIAKRKESELLRRRLLAMGSMA